MLKPKFINILFYFIVKYILFFVLLAFIGNRFKKIVIENSDTNSELLSNILYYSVYPAIILCVFTVTFSIPLYFLMKMKRPAPFVLFYFLLLIIEYFSYTYLASPSDFKNGFYNMIIGVSLLFLFFYKYLKLWLNPQIKF